MASSSSPPQKGSLSPNCPCPVDTTLPPLHAAPHPYNNTAFVFSLFPNQQFVSTIDKTGACSKKPGFTGRNSIRYHIFSDGVYQAQTYNLLPDPDGDLLRQDIRNLDTLDLKIRGWNKTYGAQPGYSRGREISVESGKVVLGKLKIEDAYQKVDLTVSTTTVNGQEITELRGTTGKYIRSLVIHYSGVTCPPDQVARIHALFKFDVEASQSCNSVNQQSETFFELESLIDNIGVSPSPGGNGEGHVAIDCRYQTADSIQLYGDQLKVTKAYAIVTDPQVYRDNIIQTDAYSAAFDSAGRLFVFYEDHKLFTKDADGNDITCACPSSSSSSSSSSSTTPGTGGGGVPPPTTPGGGGGGAGGFPGGGGSGGTHFPFSSSSSPLESSSSATPPRSSSSSSSVPPASSSSSSSLDCPGRDCIGCTGKNKKTYNSFTVGFSGYQQWQLCLSCAACEGASGFLRIDPADLSGPFCIMQDCDNKCTWENTVFVRAISRSCQNVSCNEEFVHTLLPLRIVATQAKGKWTLTATLADGDCNVYTLFEGEYSGLPGQNPPYDGCDLPGAFTNKASGLGALSQDVCCVCFPDVKETSNISCAMSPDMGLTWFDFKGLIRLVAGELARKPVVTHDRFNNRFHLFYILQGESGDGLFHKAIDASLFDENDAFIEYVPPTSFDRNSDDNVGLKGFSGVGASIRKLPSDLVQGTLGTAETDTSKARFKSGQSYRFTTTPTSDGSLVKTGSLESSRRAIFNQTSDVKTDPVKFEEYAAYMDNAGRLYLYYFDERGSLPLDQIDVPPQFFGGQFNGRSWFELRYNAALTAKLGCPSPYTFTVTGIQDSDCECNQLNGQHTFIQHGSPDNYISGNLAAPKWTMTFADGYWVIASSNGMLTFRRKRNSLECPTLGEYTLICNRCIGEGGAAGIRGVLTPTSDSSSSSMSSSSATIRPYDAKVRVLSSPDQGRTWKEELPGRGGHWGAVTYDPRADLSYLFYVTDDMLFCRRYPAPFYHEINDTGGAGQLVVETVLTVIDPGLDFDPRIGSAPEIGGTVGGVQDQLSIPAQTQEDGTITTTLPGAPPLPAERDKFGITVFVTGEKTADFSPYAYYPYSKKYKFEANQSVGAARPAAYVTPQGGVRFFYVDQKGNINGGYLASAERPLPDIKVKLCRP
jgi:hypothetical protein